MTFELVKLVSRFKVNLRQLKFYILSFIYRKGTYDIKNNYSILIKKKNDVNGKSHSECFITCLSLALCLIIPVRRRKIRRPCLKDHQWALLGSSSGILLQKTFETLTHGLVSGHRKIPFLITRFRANEMYLDVEICGFWWKMTFC